MPCSIGWTPTNKSSSGCSEIEERQPIKEVRDEQQNKTLGPRGVGGCQNGVSGNSGPAWLAVGRELLSTRQAVGPVQLDHRPVGLSRGAAMM